MDAILYRSNCGHTQRYAHMLSDKTGLPVYEWKQAGARVPAGAHVLYMGWMRAGSLVGYKKAARRYAVDAVCAVGMAPSLNAEQAGQAGKSLSLSCPVFYLQGGFEADKLTGIYRMAIKAMQKGIGGQLAWPPRRSARRRKRICLPC
nr:hypothetical protein [bacterium]